MFDELHRSLDNHVAPGDVAFDFEVPLSFFEKADEAPAKQRRIGGVMTSESPDQQRETILQRGLNFDYFIKNGWFNDNHTKKTAGIVGYPELVRQYKAGEVLPDGVPAKSACTWVEGYLLNNFTPANELWDLGQSLQGTGRRLGFSVEGAITKRQGAGNRIIARANVRNCAITNCPVNTDAKMEILARSLDAIEKSANANMEVEKMLTVGSSAPIPGVAYTSEGAGSVLVREDLEHDDHDEIKRVRKKTHKVVKSLSALEARAYVQSLVPGVAPDQADAVVRLTKALARRGYL